MPTCPQPQRLWLLTGPNMAGKSTFLRQNALIAILAQAGSFVPAERAHIGVVDRLFSRVGAADDLARGRSTFMVEMVETAAILNQATPRSLVILDEIGRGTATFDGLSIAWAVVEHLHEVNRCRALFATHFHELTALAAKLDHLVCRTMRVKEWQGDVVFLHEVAEGAADRSYGVHVARLAGLPEAVLARAEEVLHRLEQGEAKSTADLAEDLPLFAAAVGRARPKPPPGAGPSPLEAALPRGQPRRADAEGRAGADLPAEGHARHLLTQQTTLERLAGEQAHQMREHEDDHQDREHLDRAVGHERRPAEVARPALAPVRHAGDQQRGEQDGDGQLEAHGALRFHHRHHDRRQRRRVSPRSFCRAPLIAPRMVRS